MPAAPDPLAGSRVPVVDSSNVTKFAQRGHVRPPEQPAHEPPPPTAPLRVVVPTSKAAPPEDVFVVTEKITVSNGPSMLTLYPNDKVCASTHGPRMIAHLRAAGAKLKLRE